MRKNGANLRYTSVGELGRLCYGITRRRGQYDLTVTSCTARMTVRALTADAARALAVRDALAAGAVFPENVLEVLDDFVGVTL